MYFGIFWVDLSICLDRGPTYLVARWFKLPRDIPLSSGVSEANPWHGITWYSLIRDDWVYEHLQKRGYWIFGVSPKREVAPIISSRIPIISRFYTLCSWPWFHLVALLRMLTYQIWWQNMDLDIFGFIPTYSSLISKFGAPNQFHGLNSEFPDEMPRDLKSNNNSVPSLGARTNRRRLASAFSMKPMTPKGWWAWLTQGPETWSKIHPSSTCTYHSGTLLCWGTATI